MDVKLRALFPLQLCKYLTTKMNPLNLLIIKSTQCYTIYSSPYYYRNLLLEHVCAVEQLFVVYLLCVVCSSVPVVPSTTTRCPTLLTYGVSRKRCARNVQTKFNNYTVSAKSPLAFLLQTVFIYRLSTR